jgi:hypothetical protein
MLFARLQKTEFFSINALLLGEVTTKTAVAWVLP